MGSRLRCAFSAVLIIACCIFDYAAAGSGRQVIGPATVIDGDTIQVGNERIRLWGIDAFEQSQTCGYTKCGEDATFYLQGIFRDAEANGFNEIYCFERDKDRYGRIVAVCRIGGEDIGAKMVLSGYALAYRKYSLDYVPEENYARQKLSGAWIGEFQEPEDFRHPQEDSEDASPIASAPRRTNLPSGTIIMPAIITATPERATSSECRIKGNINSNGDKIYHLPNAPNYSRTVAEEIFCSEQAAISAGYRAPRNSNPRSETRQVTRRQTTVNRNTTFANCSAARAAGRAPIYYGQPGYARRLDRDGDGVACE